MADTTFGWDASHYDGLPTSRDGIDFYTHKLSDGDHYYADPTYQAHMNAQRALGTTVLGAYHVLHGGVSVTNQAAWMIQLADQRTPWWRTYPYWVWQADAEPFDYLTRPSVAECNAFCDALVAQSGVPHTSVLGYLAGWSYGAQVAGLRYPYWVSSYVSGSGPYRSLYPGSSSSHWVSGGRHGDILQFTSSAVIAGQTTSDANAFAGNLADFQAFLKGAAVTAPQDNWGYQIASPALGKTMSAADWLKYAYSGAQSAQVAAANSAEAANAIEALAATIETGGGSPDVTAIIAAIKADGDLTRGALADLGDRVTAAARAAAVALSPAPAPPQA